MFLLCQSVPVPASIRTAGIPPKLPDISRKTKSNIDLSLGVRINRHTRSINRIKAGGIPHGQGIVTEVGNNSTYYRKHTVNHGVA
jgi:hypothetical protein